MNWKIVVLATMLGTGCAAKKMVAENADFMLESQIQKRLPLYSAQKVSLSKDIDHFLNEQKPIIKEALPVISNVELNVNKVDDQYFYLKRLYDKLAYNFSELMSNHMSRMDQKQQKDFLAVLTKENKKISEIRTAEIMEKVHDRFETLFGKETEEQKKILNSFKPHFKERNQERLIRRKELHQKFQEIYAKDLTKESRATLFLDAFKEYQQKAVDTESQLSLIKQILPTLDDKQKKIFNGRVQELKEILAYFIEAAY
jgi:hypothetical protein